ncbi:MAG: hypothetical protein Q4A78_08990 [Peptostreptococcaceae bacterium]|nr:hypothetical protein [Peptostreptococcaceae bacterium]
MKISQYVRAGFEDLKARSLHASAERTRWEDVFGQAQQKAEEKKTDSGYFSPAPSADEPKVKEVRTEARRAAVSVPAGMTSLNLRIQPRQIEYERYKRSNDLEKLQAERKDYDAAKVTNPFHHSKTHNYFNDDLRASFKELYGDWDGRSEDGKGFAYVDKYGFSGVAENFFTAMVYSMDGKVYNYEGRQMGGYAVNAEGKRVALLGMDHSVLFGNFRSGDPSFAPQGNEASSVQKLDEKTMTASEAAAVDFVSRVKLNLFDFANFGRFASSAREEKSFR